MPDVHVHIAEGLETVYPEERIAELLREGTLTPETYYWRPGMPQWRPLSTFKPSQHAVVPERRTDALPEVSPRRVWNESELPAISERTSRTVSGSRRFRFRRKPQLLTHLVQGLLVLAFLVAAAELGLAVLDMPRDEIIPNVTSWKHLRSVLGWSGLGLDFVLLIFYCVWIYRSNLNCHGFSSIVRFKGKWAIGCHFVPVMNLIRPYQVMQEIWKVSANPRAWQNDPPSVMVTLWWTFWLLTLGLAEAGYLARDMARTEAALTDAAFVFIGLKAVQAIWFVLFLAMVSLVLRNQVRLVSRSTAPARKRERRNTSEKRSASKKGHEDI